MKFILAGMIGAAASLAVSSFAAAGAQTAPAPGDAAALALFRDIIAIRTVKGRGETARLAERLADEFEKAGFARADMEFVPVDGETGFILRWRGDRSAGAGPILFLAHMDVVDVADGDWDFDPWTVTEKDGRFYGRGVVDNKYGVLTLARAFITLKQEGFAPTRDLVIAFTGDEETEMKTTRALAEKLKDAEFALNADAGGGFKAPDGGASAYYVQAAEKTYVTFEIAARNKGGHSSQPREDNAIYDLADALVKIEAHEFPVMWNEVTLKEMAASSEIESPETAAAMRAFVRKPGDRKAAKKLLGVDYLRNGLRTTCVATMLKAGHAENALPQSATATVNCRVFPGVPVEAVKAELQRVVGDPAIEFATLGDPVESPASIPGPELERAVLAAAQAQAEVTRVIPYMEAGGTDGMHFRRAGVPTFGVGPMFVGEGDVDGIHGRHESISAGTFYSGLKHFPALIRAVAGRPDD